MKSLQLGIGPFFGGALFAIGLGVSGMTEAKNIIGFLDIFGDWQGELLLVMGSALLVYGLLFRLVLRRSKPLFQGHFSLPTTKGLDRRLIFGAVFFGLGWGMTGLCPGPGIVTLVSQTHHSIVFVITMIIGMLIGGSRLGDSFFGKEKE